jgi:hypothetical protein
LDELEPGALWKVRESYLLRKRYGLVVVPVPLLASCFDDMMVSKA